MTVSFTCVDPLSAIVGGCPPPVILDTEGAEQGVSQMVTTEGGLSLEAGVTDINIDLTNPTVTYTGGKASYQVDEQVSITCTAADALSGVASTTCANVSGPAYSFGLGSHTFSASATDRAGNTGSGSVTFTVGVTYTSLCNLSSGSPTAGGSEPRSARCSGSPSPPTRTTTPILKKLSLQAYVLLVRAQTGRTLTATEAATLIASRGACNPMTSHKGDSGHMKRRLVALAAVALAIVAVPSALADPPAKPTKQKLTQIKLLAFNDFHGHLEAGTPGTIVNPATGARRAFRRRRVLRHTHEGTRIRECRHVTSSARAT